MKQVILCVTNDLENDQRVHRTAVTLQNAGWDVTVCGRLLPRSKDFFRSYKIRRFRLLFVRSWLFYTTYNIRLLLFLLTKRYTVIFANDIDTLPAAWLASKIRGKKLVFDSHELFSEVPELQDRKKIKKIWIKIEDYLIPKIDYGITVCDPIAEIYKQKYNKDFEVIRNVPLRKEGINNKEYNPYQIIYQGAINKGRGLELLLDSMQFFPEATITIVGVGDIENKLKKMISTKKIEKRVTLLGHIPYDQLNNITKTAAVGVSIEEEMGLNYRFALPNKLFDYIQAGVPVVVSNLPVMSKIVNDYNVGEILMERTPQALAQTLITVIQKRNMGYYNDNLKIAAETLNWDNEKQKLLAIFADLN